MNIVQGNNINEIQLELLNLLKASGTEVFVRNEKTLEIYPVIIKLDEIRNRCTTLSVRNWNLIFAIGELSWHLAGSDDLEFINYYSKNWSVVSADKRKIRESCYGAKMFGPGNAWDKLIKELKADKNSRRAVINLYDSNRTLGENKLDVSCTVSLQFLIRNNKLDLITTMRSNDIIWGLPNDVFVFTMIQELLANQLNILPGQYFHQIASLHIYERHYKLLDEITSNPRYFDFKMDQMVDVKHVPSFLKGESILRSNLNEKIKVSSKYWNDLLNVIRLRSLKTTKEGGAGIINSSPYKEVLNLCSPTYL